MQQNKFSGIGHLDLNPARLAASRERLIVPQRDNVEGIARVQHQAAPKQTARAVKASEHLTQPTAQAKVAIQSAVQPAKAAVPQINTVKAAAPARPTAQRLSQSKADRARLLQALAEMDGRSNVRAEARQEAAAKRQAEAARKEAAEIAKDQATAANTINRALENAMAQNTSTTQNEQSKVESSSATEPAGFTDNAMDFIASPVSNIVSAAAMTAEADEAKPASNVATEGAANTNPSTDPDDDINLMVDPSGTVAVAQPNVWQRLAGAQISVSFKFNKDRFFSILRYLAIVVILAASAYLAWDTYSTNKAVQSNFANPAQAMSIAGVNPATADQTSVSQEAKQAYTVASDLPRLITIPSIGVNARVQSVGVNSQGNIDTPKNLNDTAWYDGSAKPNQDGQVFIDGHTSFSRTIDAAFNDLGKMKQGDQIVVETGNGAKYTYRVTAIETVDAAKVDMGKALNVQQGSTKGITLMTCTGTFNYRTQQADKRLIVYGVQE